MQGHSISSTVIVTLTARPYLHAWVSSAPWSVAAACPPYKCIHVVLCAEQQHLVPDSQTQLSRPLVPVLRRVLERGAGA